MDRVLLIATACVLSVTGQNAGNNPTSVQCLGNYATVMSSSPSLDETCQAVVDLSKCIATTGDTSAQKTVDEIVAKYKCDPTKYQNSPQITTNDNHLHFAVDESNDIKFFRFRREETSVWTLANNQQVLSSSITAVDKRLNGSIATTQQTIDDMQATVDDAVDKIKDDTQDTLDKFDDQVSKALDAQSEASVKQLANMSATIDAVTADLVKQIKNLTEQLNTLKNDDGNCNYATHYKKDGKCIMFTDCAAASANTVYYSGGRGGERQHTSFIWQKGNQTHDHVCASASYNQWYRLDGRVYFFGVPWPKWQFPKYTEAAAVQVCRMAGLRPWRDEGAWNCDSGQYVCDNWGYNLGGHDLINKLICLVSGNNCYGHSGSQTISRTTLASDIVRFGFPKDNNGKIRVVTKRHHTSYSDMPCFVDLRVNSAGSISRLNNYNCDTREVVPDLIYCAETRSY